jgi:alpha-galactosidase
MKYIETSLSRAFFRTATSHRRAFPKHPFHSIQGEVSHRDRQPRRLLHPLHQDLRPPPSSPPPSKPASTTNSSTPPPTRNTRSRVPLPRRLRGGRELIVTNTGLPNKPTLILTIRLYADQPYGDLTVEVRNTTDQPLTIQSIRTIQAAAPSLNLNAPASADRVISDSYSEDRPQLAIHDLGDAPKGMLRAVGTQLIYNRQSHVSLFLGALTTDRLLTVFHLREQGTGADAKILSYEAAATGTTEIMKEESLRDAPPAEQVSLSLPVAPGASLSSERLMFAIGTTTTRSSSNYAHVIKLLHHARVDAPTPMGWWLDRLLLRPQPGPPSPTPTTSPTTSSPSATPSSRSTKVTNTPAANTPPPTPNLFPKGLGYVAK